MTGLDRNFKIAVAVIFFLTAGTAALAADPKASSNSKKSAAAESPKSTAVKPGKTNLPKVLDFGTSWCAPCKKFGPVFDKVSKNYKDKVEFVHYDAEKGAGVTVADKYKVTGYPTVVFLTAKDAVSSKVERLMTEADLIKTTDALLK